MPTGLPGGSHELINLSLSEVFPRPEIRILQSYWGNYPIFGSFGERFEHTGYTDCIPKYPSGIGKYNPMSATELLRMSKS